MFSYDDTFRAVVDCLPGCVAVVREVVAVFVCDDLLRGRCIEVVLRGRVDRLALRVVAGERLSAARCVHVALRNEIQGQARDLRPMQEGPEEGRQHAPAAEDHGM